MKKMVKFCLSCLLLVGLSACGSSTSETGNNNGDTQVSPTSELITTEENKKNDGQAYDSDLLPGEYHIPLKEIYFSVPNYHETELGYTERFAVYDKQYVTITGDRYLEASSCKEAFEVCSKDFLAALEKTSAQEFKIETDEVVTINGIEMYRFEGKLLHKLGGDLYTRGYAFAIDGVACQITGVVEDKSQPQELIDEVRNVVDEMAKSVRTTP